ncbi:aminotransferase class III-fold pyridoxal phosphate-dependent enzyme [Candidatus Woesearchaeota archaeon]|nr:aminotransferase class III-fold pyridoxal phosphate-dependent enzyme [Candidatus Woesearchaeota archaeon]
MAIIQARMGSTRLPGKMLKKINGKPLIFYALEQIKKSKLIDKMVLATTNKKRDVVLLNTVKQAGYDVFAGDEDDVLDRYYQAAKLFKGDIIVRLTGDCPLIDANIIDYVLQKFKDDSCDYASNIHPPTFPDGLDVEVFSFNSLEKAWGGAKLNSEREHVTPYIWKNKDKFKLLNLKNDTDFSEIRLTVDEEDDFLFINKLLNKIGNREITLNLIAETLQKFPELRELNNKFERNEGYAKSIKEDKMKEITNFERSIEWLKKAKEVIPSASQTYSKSYKYFCEGAGPAFLEKGDGAYVWDIDGNEYIDFICALGPVTVGYNNKEVNGAIIEQLSKGISFSQSTLLEIKLAEKLVEIIPCAEMVRFVKNGSDATSAAVRLARAYTKKDIVLVCGYHGCQDWFIGSTAGDFGVPDAVKMLVKKFEYNDIDSLKQLFEENKDKVAAVIMEPMQENGPNRNYLNEVKKMTHENGAVLIFDEVLSGFRMALGGAQQHFNVIPDLSALGKGVANGLPLSAVVGKKEIMNLIDEGAFISMTFGGETLSLAAALKTIEILERESSFEYIWELGNRWKKGIQELIDKKDISNIARVVGAAPHCGVLFSKAGSLTEHDLFSIFQQKLISKGILSLGINNFCLSHTKEDIDKFIKAADIAFEDVIKAVEKDSVEGILIGQKFRPIFKRN